MFGCLFNHGSHPLNKLFGAIESWNSDGEKQCKAKEASYGQTISLISDVLAFILVAGLLTSCRAFPMEKSRATQTLTQSTEPIQSPIDTPTLAPTVTNTPTDTPPPTETPLPPTPTPDASATAEVLATQTAESVLSEI